jgi:hypothetical protein
MLQPFSGVAQQTRCVRLAERSLVHLPHQLSPSAMSKKDFRLLVLNGDCARAYRGTHNR